MSIIDTTATIHLDAIQRGIIDIPVENISPLIVHKWSEKSKRLMREKQSGSTARPKHDPKDPIEEAESCLYRLPDGRPGMPATAFKAATVGAARLYSGVTMTAIKAALFVHGEGPDQLVPIEGDMTLREDTPRNASGVADLRYRYQFDPWTAIIRVEFITAMIDEKSVVALVDAGGNGGIGDWRPSAPKSLTGTYGRYRVASI
jgi:hypothetical protein